MVSKVFRGRYFRGHSIWEINGWPTNSWMWKSLLSSKHLLEVGTRRKLGDDKSIKIWTDKWLPDQEDGRIDTRKLEECNKKKVSELIKDGKCDSEIITKMF